MPPSLKATVAERLYWSYANLAMAEMAVHDHDAKYSRKHFMIRARLYSGLTKGTMSPRSLMRDQRIRMKLAQECVYCGDTHLPRLTILCLPTEAERTPATMLCGRAGSAIPRNPIETFSHGGSSIALAFHLSSW